MASDPVEEVATRDRCVERVDGDFVENNIETREWLAGRIQAMDASRTDIGSLFDYLDLDDYLSFGGQA